MILAAIFVLAGVANAVSPYGFVKSASPIAGYVVTTGDG